MEEILLNHALNLTTEIPSITDIHCRRLSKSDVVDEGYYQSIGSLEAEISFQMCARLGLPLLCELPAF